ncbi:uncharacterized protein NECHADRAFT_88472 [Fusarium vanettenii 77-13-4]|uniref:Uncharacterized protein n=1 Tax=Fusarium vanettenii (strain ATCC MYA-4622 / CBS 123669 / FGSC 9596 / NRRL 45880 / 77-13-4) TaxID=660122 RepID=C7ZBN3_FUSV7|nr:uncharacterized protein NECHADRAFT_88472 [Fusarium vanettenii 77-13-4]EEU38594.1 predicted protein [Fusarium vanettenii 77-13-4]
MTSFLEGAIWRGSELVVGASRRFKYHKDDLLRYLTKTAIDCPLKLWNYQFGSRLISVNIIISQHCHLGRKYNPQTLDVVGSSETTSRLAIANAQPILLAEYFWAAYLNVKFIPYGNYSRYLDKLDMYPPMIAMPCHDHNPSLRRGASLQPNNDTARNSNTGSIYISLKSHIDDLLDVFKNERHTSIIDEHVSQALPNDELQQPLLEPIFAPPTGRSAFSQTFLLPPVRTIKQSFRASICSAKRVGHQLSDSRSGQMRRQTTLPNSYGENSRSNSNIEVKVESRAKPCSDVGDPFLLGTSPQHLNVENTSLENTLHNYVAARSIRKAHDTWGEEKTVGDVPLGTDGVEKSYFDTSSETETVETRRLSSGQRISKIKNSTIRWLRDAFSLDEDEKAFFASRRIASVDELFIQRATPMFIDGRRIRPVHST